MQLLHAHGLDILRFLKHSCFMIYCFYFEATSAVFGKVNIFLHSLPLIYFKLSISFIYYKESFVIQDLNKDKIKSDCFLLSISKLYSGKAVYCS